MNLESNVNSTLSFSLEPSGKQGRNYAWLVTRMLTQCLRWFHVSTNTYAQTHMGTVNDFGHVFRD